MAAQAVQVGEWVSKDEAARLLGVGHAQVEKRARQGLLRKRLLPKGPKEKQARVVYMRGDIDAFLAGTPHRDNGVPVRASDGRPAVKATELAHRDPFGGLAAHLAQLSAAFPPRVDPAPWLTLEEAANFSGLTKAWLLKEADSGEGGITTRDMGKHARGGRWRFFRADLERAE